MSTSKKDKSTHIKELALAGKFLEIQAIYGASSELKAREYALVKLKRLRELNSEVGEGALQDKGCTPFMVYAMQCEVQQVSIYYFGDAVLIC